MPDEELIRRHLESAYTYYIIYQNEVCHHENRGLGCLGHIGPTLYRHKIGVSSRTGPGTARKLELSNDLSQS